MDKKSWKSITHAMRLLDRDRDEYQSGRVVDEMVEGGWGERTYP